MRTLFQSKIYALAVLCFVYLPFSSRATIVITGGSWTSHGFGATVTDPDITINGTFTIDVNATFDNCPNIKMGSGAVIEVLNGVNFTADNSHFYTAGAWMWAGIEVQGTPTTGGFIHMTETIVEDARSAISGFYYNTGMMANYSFDLTHVKFNRNEVSVEKISYGDPFDPRLAPTAGYFTGATHSVNGFLITCVDDITSATPNPANLKSGIATKPASGMNFARCGNLQIKGHLHPFTYLGVFQYLNAGINTVNCDLHMENCYFTDIKDYDGGLPYWAAFNGVRGAGIFGINNVQAGVPIPFARQAVVTATSFNQCEWGIAFSRPLNLSLTNSSMTKCVLGIEHYGDVNGNLLIDHCDLTDCDNGILTYGNNATTTTITNSTISTNFPGMVRAKGPYLYTSAYHPNNIPINISPALPALSGTTTISNNTISGGINGICLNLVEGADISDNTIHYTAFNTLSTPPYVSVGSNRHGIYLFGGKGNTVSGNSIRGYAGSYTSSIFGGAFGTAYEMQHGVTAINSPANTIGCNNTGALYSGFHFAGNNANTTLSVNNFETGQNFVTGIYMQAWGTGGAVISQQGTAGGDPHFNTFNGTFNYPGGYQSTCDGSTDGGLSKFFYASGGTAAPSPNLGIFPILALGLGSSSAIPPACVPPLRLTGRGNTGSNQEPVDLSSLDWAFAIAGNTLYSSEPFADFLRFESNKFLYAYLGDRPALRSASPVLANFYTAQGGTPVAMLCLADSLLRNVGTDTLHVDINSADSGQIIAALGTLGGIGSGLPFASLEAEVRSLAAAKLLGGGLDYTTAEKTRLEYISSLCPGLEGMGVYMARNLVRLWSDSTYNDDTACLNSGNGMLRRTAGASMWAQDGLPPVTAIAGLQHWLKPNPASTGTTQLVLSHTLDHNTSVRIFDLTGKLVQTVLLQAGILQTLIPTAQMPAAMYLYSNEDASIKGKLIVQ